MFGHPSMLSGMPTGFEVRAAEDVLTYALAADDVLPLLGRPEGLRFLGRSILDRPRPAALSPVELAGVRGRGPDRGDSDRRAAGDRGARNRGARCGDAHGGRRRHLRRGPAQRRRLRDHDRPRPALEPDRCGPARGRARSGGDDLTGAVRWAGPDGRRADAADARPRHPPRAGGLGALGGARRRPRHRSARGRDPDSLHAEEGDRRRDEGRGAGQGGRAAQPDLRLAAPGGRRRPADQHDHLGRVRRALPPHDRARDRARSARRPPSSPGSRSEATAAARRSPHRTWTPAWLGGTSPPRTPNRRAPTCARSPNRSRSRSSSPACRSTLTGSRAAATSPAARSPSGGGRSGAGSPIPRTTRS